MTPPPPPVGCPCKRTDELCDECRGETFRQLRGVAASRGIQWSEALARLIPQTHRWPAATERMQAIARRKVSDLSRDKRLREMLAAELIAAAARAWDKAMEQVG